MSIWPGCVVCFAQGQKGQRKGIEWSKGPDGTSSPRNVQETPFHVVHGEAPVGICCGPFRFPPFSAEPEKTQRRLEHTLQAKQMWLGLLNLETSQLKEDTTEVC